MPFSNPIIAGTKLIREAIESPNYVPGSMGWSINKDGTAEFSDLTVRGRFESSDPVNGDVVIDDGQIVATGDTYTLQLANGRVLIFTNDIPDLSNMELAAGFLTMQDASGNQCSLVMDGNNLSLLVGSNGIVMDPNGYIFRSDSPVENWNAVTVFSNGFGNLAGFATAAYKKYPDGKVMLRGSVTRVGAIVDFSQVFSLPVGYRPPADVAIPVANLGNNSAVNPRIRITAAGAVLIAGFTSGSIANAAFGMDGASFSVI